MERPEWGLFPEAAKNARIYWGARAIISNRRIELLWDRQSFRREDGVSEEESNEFIKYINESVIPALNVEVKKGRTECIKIMGAKNRFVQAEDHSSGGYLYIGVWEL